MPASSPSRPHHRLRAATQAAHEAVDVAYGRFDLADAADYRDFLAAHARALPAVEQVLATAPAIPPFRPRTPALADDLAALGAALPSPLPLPPPAGDAAAWGMLYVIEGSRLGGGMLARAVAPALPRAYLSATHLSGEWRALLAAFDAAATSPAWEADALAAARTTFALYAAAAAMGPDER